MESQSKQQAFQEFTLFPRLAPELRLKIWKIASRQPRIVEVNIYRVLGYPKHWRSITPQPGVLSTCRESREEGLKVYKIMERQNKVYKPDDGSIFDIPPHNAHHYEFIDRPEFYHENDTCCSPPRCNANYSTPHMIAKSRTDSFAQDRDPIPTFRTYINYALDTIYLHTNHSCSPGALSGCIQSMTWAWWNDLASPPLQRIAFNIEHLRDLFQYNNMVEFVRWAASDMSKLWVIAGDDCCDGPEVGHTAVKNFVEYTSQDEVALSGSDLTLYDDYIAECEVEMDNLRQDGISTKLEIVLGLAVREAVTDEGRRATKFRGAGEIEKG